MDELSKFVTHIRNLKQQGVREATFDVEYLTRVLERINPSADTVRKIKAEQNIVGDGGGFYEE